MSDRLLTRNEAKARRLAVKRHVQAQGYSKSFTEQMYLRLVQHDKLRRGRAIVQALQGYRPAP